MTTRRPPQEASPLAAEADPSPEIQYLVEPERRMSDLSSEKPDGAKRFSTRGNWHMRPRVGIMGGTFDPIHNGHLVAASEVAWVYDLDEVIFVPTGRPVFKLDKQVTNAEDRYLMTVIATASNPKFTVSRVDIDRPGVTYTAGGQHHRGPGRARDGQPAGGLGGMTTRRPPQEASPLAAEADPSPEIQYLVEPERRMSDLSSEKPDGAKRFSTRGNWHMRPRVGIMGGTFDPIHNGHLVAASEVAWVYDLDEVIFVPTGRPVFKLDKQVTNAEDRYLMTVIATASNPKFTVSRVDIDRPGVTYTIDTLRDLRSQHPDAELFFITGADAVAEIMEWKDADQMWDLAHFVAVTRPGYSSPQGVRLPDGKVDTLEIPALAISSTDVRRRATHGEPVWYLVPDGVVQYIGKHGLYRRRSG